MQIEEQHGQSITLTLVKQGEEISSMHQDEGDDGVQLILDLCDNGFAENSTSVSPTIQPVVGRVNPFTPEKIMSY